MFVWSLVRYSCAAIAELRRDEAIGICELLTNFQYETFLVYRIVARVRWYRYMLMYIEVNVKLNTTLNDVKRNGNRKRWKFASQFQGHCQWKHTCPKQNLPMKTFRQILWWYWKLTLKKGIKQTKWKEKLKKLFRIQNKAPFVELWFIIWSTKQIQRINKGKRNHNCLHWGDMCCYVAICNNIYQIGRCMCV